MRRSNGIEQRGRRNGHVPFHAGLPGKEWDHVNFRKGTTLALVAGGLLLGPSTSLAQYERGHEQHRDFYNGAYNSGRGGSYDRGTNYRNNYRGDDRGYRGDDRYRGHGIGTGTGAAIGGAGGAALGAVFGGGLKGALIGGAAGAGIGAIAGHAHQENQKRDYYRGH